MLIPWNAASWRSRTYARPRSMSLVRVGKPMRYDTEPCPECRYQVCSCKSHGTLEERQNRLGLCESEPWVSDVPLPAFLEWLRDEESTVEELVHYLPQTHPKYMPRPPTPPPTEPPPPVPDEPVSYEKALAKAIADERLQKIVDAYLGGDLLSGVDPEFAAQTLDRWAAGVMAAGPTQVDPWRLAAADNWQCSRAYVAVARGRARMTDRQRMLHDQAQGMKAYIAARLADRVANA